MLSVVKVGGFDDVTREMSEISFLIVNEQKKEIGRVVCRKCR
jgi:hypothetical protein